MGRQIIFNLYIYLGTFMIAIILSFFLIFSSSVLFSGPIRVERLVKERGDEQPIIVTLIGDIHDPQEQKVWNPSKTAPSHLLTMDEKQKFSSAERTLLIESRKLGKPNTKQSITHQKNQSGKRPKHDKSPKEPISVLWESNDSIIDQNSGQFIRAGGAKLSTEFTNEIGESNKAKNLIFIHSDTYRTNDYRYGSSFILNQKSFEENSRTKEISVQQTFQQLFSLAEFGNQHPQVAADLEKVTDSAIKEKLIQTWNDYIKIIKNIHNRYLVPHENLSLHDFSQLPEFNEFKEYFLRYALAQPMDHEVVTKIFGPGKHKIVYAGDAHCNNIKDILTKEFDFASVMERGIHYKFLEEQPGKYNPLAQKETFDTSFNDPIKIYQKTADYAIPLNANIWKILFQTPLAITQDNKTSCKLFAEEEIDTFFLAVKAGDLPKIQELFKKACQAQVDLVNAQEYDTGYTPLFHAIKENQIETVTFLLKHTAYPTITDRKGNNALHIAIQTGTILAEQHDKTIESPEKESCKKAMLQNIAIIQKLIDKGTPFLLRNNEGKTALKELLPTNSYGATVQNIMIKSPFWKKYGENISKEDAEKNTMLHQATFNNQTKESSAKKIGLIIKLLRRTNNHKNVLNLINAQNNNGDTALHFATMARDIEGMNVLIKNGASKTIKNEEGQIAADLMQDFLNELSSDPELLKQLESTTALEQEELAIVRSSLADIKQLIHLLGKDHPSYQANIVELAKLTASFKKVEKLAIAKQFDDSFAQAVDTSMRPLDGYMTRKTEYLDNKSWLDILSSSKDLSRLLSNPTTVQTMHHEMKEMATSFITLLDKNIILIKDVRKATLKPESISTITKLLNANLIQPILDAGKKLKENDDADSLTALTQLSSMAAGINEILHNELVGQLKNRFPKLSYAALEETINKLR